MSKVLWHMMMSLDGFIADADRSTSWVARYAASRPPEVDEVIASTGAVLGGRRGYDLGRRSRQRLKASGRADGSWQGPVFVLTHDPPHDELDPKITFLSGNIHDSVATALQAAAGKNLLILGADVAGQCIDAGLIDEILVHIVPVLLGQGTRFFGHSRTPVRLETVSISRSGPLASLRFRVVM